jgi:hypothetical protein
MEYLLPRFNDMRRLPIVILLTLILALTSGSALFAQRRQARTGSAKAAYGYPVENYSKKKKAKKKRKKQQPKPAKKNETPLSRKRDPWVH